MKEIIDNIMENAKKAYKESIIIDNIVIQDLILTIITETKKLQEIPKKELNTVRHIPSTRERVLLEDSQSNDINVIAYIFSEYEHTALFPNMNQTEAVSAIADLMNVKYKTFTNRRDRYDRYTNSHRVGWDEDLPSSLQDIFDELVTLSKEQVLNKGKKILEKYSQ